MRVAFGHAVHERFNRQFSVFLIRQAPKPISIYHRDYCRVDWIADKIRFLIPKGGKVTVKIGRDEAVGPGVTLKFQSAELAASTSCPIGTNDPFGRQSSVACWCGGRGNDPAVRLLQFR